jgi:uncharacterized protein (DUF488 family)
MIAPLNSTLIKRMSTLYTIGHSTHSIERFLDLLSTHQISAIADVRSMPFSRHTPQFNREPLAHALAAKEIDYVFLGKELGARPVDSGCYVDGQVRFDLLAKSALFRLGLKRLATGMDSYRIALLCAEKDPITCHRMILVCRNVPQVGITDVRHILEDACLEKNSDAERRLLSVHNIEENDLFAAYEELVQKAYDLQSAKIAYTEKNDA